MKKILLLLTASLMSFSILADETPVATVVRAHPRLTRGLARESLLGIRFDGGWGGTISNTQTLDFRFDFTNCTRSVISDVKLWYMGHNNPRPYAFYEASATPISATKNNDESADGSWVNMHFSGMTHTMYPKTAATGDSGYIWLTATIAENIPENAEIWVSLQNSQIVINGGAFVVQNGKAKSPHRVLPNRYQVTAYLRGDRISGTSAGILEGNAEARFANLTDVIVVNNLKAVYDSANDRFGTTWNAASTDSVKRVIELRDAHNSACRVRLSLTRGDTYATVGGIPGYPLACAACNDTYRAQLVDAVIAVIEECGADGLDIDWEYPGVHNGAKVSDDQVARDWNGYGLLLRDLAAAFFDRDWTLSICANESGWCMAPDGYYAAMHAADMIESMAYDFNGGDYPLHSSPYAMKYAMSTLTDRGISVRRVISGQAMYSNWNYQPGWEWIVNNWIGNDYDRDTYLVEGKYASFEGPTTYRAKCNYARQQNYGGIMSWGYYSDTAWEHEMALARHQANAIWPMPYKWPTPEQDAEGWYLLKSETDFFWLAEHGTVNARFANDITLNHDPLPMGGFSGVLEGDGFKLIIPKDTWIVSEGRTALIKNCSGVIRNLTIDFAGRAVTRAARWNDVSEGVSANTIGELYNDCGTAVLVGTLNAGGKLLNIKLKLGEGSEIQGARKAAGLTSDIYSDTTALATVVSNCKIEAAGVIRTRYENSWGGTYSQDYSCAAPIAAWVGGGGDIKIADCKVLLKATSQIKVEQGAKCAVAGAIADLNNNTPVISDLKVFVAKDANISQADGAHMASPAYAVGSYSIENGAALVNVKARVNVENDGIVLNRGVADQVVNSNCYSLLLGAGATADTAVGISGFDPVSGKLRITATDSGISEIAKPSIVYYDAELQEAETKTVSAYTWENGELDCQIDTDEYNFYRVKLSL